jgi:Lar family restriction alleviation protein
MNVKNLPCPFCGSANILLDQGYYGTKREENYTVCCGDCGTLQGGFEPLNEGIEYPHASPEKAWEAWNKRAEMK